MAKLENKKNGNEVYRLTVYKTQEGLLVASSQGTLRYKPLKRALKSELRSAKLFKALLNANPKIKKVKPVDVKKAATKVARKTSKFRKA